MNINRHWIITFRIHRTKLLAPARVSCRSINRLPGMLGSNTVASGTGCSEVDEARDTRKKRRRRRRGISFLNPPRNWLFFFWGDLLSPSSSSSSSSDSLSTPHSYPLLGAFTKLGKANISFVMYFCQSVRMEQLGRHWTDRHEIWCLRTFFFFKISLENSNIH